MTLEIKPLGRGPDRIGAATNFLTGRMGNARCGGLPSLPESYQIDVLEMGRFRHRGV